MRPRGQWYDLQFTQQYHNILMVNDINMTFNIQSLYMYMIIGVFAIYWIVIGQYLQDVPRTVPKKCV